MAPNTVSKLSYMNVYTKGIHVPWMLKYILNILKLRKNKFTRLTDSCYSTCNSEYTIIHFYVCFCFLNGKVLSPCPL